MNRKIDRFLRQKVFCVPHHSFATYQDCMRYFPMKNENSPLPYCRHWSNDFAKSQMPVNEKRQKLKICPITENKINSTSWRRSKAFTVAESNTRVCDWESIAIVLSSFDGPGVNKCFPFIQTSLSDI
jgi:hypothetical protein